MTNDGSSRPAEKASVSGRGARAAPALIQQRLGFAALIAVAAIGWGFLVASERAMERMEGEGPVMDLMWRMMAPSDAGPYLAAAALMWVVMMVAMMIPAVLPMTALFRRMAEGRRSPFDPSIFALGYLVGWSLFALVAAAIQWWLHAGGWLRGALLATGLGGAGVLLIAAGCYQLTPFKDACLARCRSPIGFFAAHWREGSLGALRMGLGHGLYCIGCCWMLMLLMFAGGVMSVATMAVLSAFILAERLLPAGPWVARGPGVAMIMGGVALLMMR